MTADYLDCLKTAQRRPASTTCRGRPSTSPTSSTIIAGLIDKGFAYPAGGDVYFDVTKDADYGKLCHRDPEQLEAGARIEVSDKKRNPGDFALWKGAKPGEPAWDSPVGAGPARLAHRMLGHEHEAPRRHARHPRRRPRPAVPAPRERAGPVANRTPASRSRAYWMHNGLLEDGHGEDGRLGRQRRQRRRRCCQHMSGDAMRFFLLSTHYRSPIDMGDWDPAKPLPSGMLAAKAAHDTFVRFAERVKRVVGTEFAKLDLPTPVSRIAADGHHGSGHVHPPLQPSTWTTTSTPAARSAFSSNW